MKSILVTGGAGFIGSHTCVVLARAGHKLVILDNFCNSHRGVIDQLTHLCGSRPLLIEGDVRNPATLDELFTNQTIDAVVHCAGLKAVGESIDSPLAFYDSNVVGTLQLLAAMNRAAVKIIVFSSSATVYGNPTIIPIRENFTRSATNPYGRSKLIVEDILADLSLSDKAWRIARLRYFNPVGAHESGIIGERPWGVPNNLIPYIAQVAAGQREHVSVFGDDYPTADGTGVRDYVHVCDVAEGHVLALKHLQNSKDMLTVNFGTGRGYSVLQVIRAFEKASGRDIPYKVVPRRSGDVAECWADATLAKTLLAWESRFDLNRMCIDAWRWQQYCGAHL